MKKVEEPTVRKALTVATSRIPWRQVLGLLAAIAVMSMVVPSRAQLHHVPPAAPSFTVLHSFAGGADGAQPVAGLIRDAAGNLYGTTYVGGGSDACGYGCGTVFKLSPTGTETVLHSFINGMDGSSPNGLLRDAAGNLYGTANSGGADGAGVVFKLSSIGTDAVLYTVTGGADGFEPNGPLIQDAVGNLYGTTNAGGSTTGTCRCGVVFELIRRNSGYDFKVLQNFTGGADGAIPAGLVRDAAGNLYGTTSYGGGGSKVCTDAPGGCGTVFKLSPTGTKTILHRFTGGADGAHPAGNLIQDAAGNLYGTTEYGEGVVFKLSPTGCTYTILYSFTGGADGAGPSSGVIRDAADNLYGTTLGGGAYGAGVVFKLSPTGTETVLHSFTGGPDGANPFAGLVPDTAGNLYGTTLYGGAASSTCAFGNGCGVVFRLAP
jgi:uncharacterized repeat protein (TIGR03803 family)